MNYFEVNDENNNMSDWLKEQTKISKERSKEAMLKMPKVHKPSTFKCCENQRKITSNDGNKHQQCLSCG